MVYPVIWSAEAVEDLESIANYIAKDSEFYASAVIDKLLATSRLVPDHAFLGRVVPEFADEKIRERFVYSYRLIYKLNTDTITIIAIIHGKRLIETISDRLHA